MVRRARKKTRFPFKPDYAVPPGSTLLETIEAQGLDPGELARRTGYTVEHISRIITGKAAISATAAARFEQVTGVPTHFWIRLEEHYRTQILNLDSRAMPVITLR